MFLIGKYYDRSIGGHSTRAIWKDFSKEIPEDYFREKKRKKSDSAYIEQGLYMRTETLTLRKPAQ